MCCTFQRRTDGDTDALEKPAAVFVSHLLFPCVSSYPVFCNSPASTRQEKKNSLISLCYLCGLRGAGRMVLVSTESWFGRMESAKATNKSCTSHSGAWPNSSVRLPLTCEAEDLCRVQSVGVSTTEQWSASLKQTAFASIEGGFVFLKVEA